MVEGIDQAHSLVKKFLRLSVVGGDGMVQISQPGHQGGFPGGGLIVRRVLLGGDGTRKHKRYQDADRELHGSFSSSGLRALNTGNSTPAGDGQLTRFRHAGGYCFFPNISRSKAVVCAAGSLRIFRSSSPIT